MPQGKTLPMFWLQVERRETYEVEGGHRGGLGRGGVGDPPNRTRCRRRRV